MKAAVINEYGGPEVIGIAELPDPKPEANQVLVRVVAGSFNPVDGVIRSGVLKDFRPVTFPYILGGDMAGIVEEVGSDATGFAKGDRVYAYANFFKQGVTTELVAIDSADLAHAPKSIPLKDAAVLPVVACTAWQGLFDHGGLQSGQRVLIVGGSGGVGTNAIQLAKWKGAYVIAAGSTKNVDLLRSLGADEVIDYKQGAIEAQLNEPVDLVLNASSAKPPEVTALLSALRPGGILVSPSSPADADVAKQLGVRATGMVVDRNKGHLAQLAQLVDDGKLRPVVSEYKKLRDIQSIHAKPASHGKVSIEIASDTAA